MMFILWVLTAMYVLTTQTIHVTTTGKWIIKQYAVVDRSRQHGTVGSICFNRGRHSKFETPYLKQKISAVIKLRYKVIVVM